MIITDHFVTAQAEHELIGNEDPAILNAYITFLPSKVAYKEGQFTHRLHAGTWAIPLSSLCSLLLKFTTELSSM